MMTAPPSLKLVHDSGREWSAPIIEAGRAITGPLHRLEVLGYLPYVLPGGNPRTGKLSPLSKIKPSNFGKVPVELNGEGLYRGIRKWTKRAATTRGEANVWQKRAENQLIRTGKIRALPKDAEAVIPIDCDAETAEMSAAFLAVAEKKFGRLSLRRRPDKPHRWLALVQGVGDAGDLTSIRTVYVDREGREARIEILISDGEFVAGGVNASGAAWGWPDGMPPLSELKEATTNDILDLEREFKAVVVAHGGKLGTEKERRQTAKPREPRKSRPRVELTAERWINQQALDNILKWAPKLFPRGHASGDGAWRVDPDGTGRDCEEDLSIHPDGIYDFGGEKPYTAISLVQGFFDEDGEGDLTEAEDFDDDYTPLGTASSKRAIAELCQHLLIDWEAETAKDRELSFEQAQVDFADTAKLYPEYLEGLEAPAQKPRANRPDILLFDNLGQLVEASDFVEDTLSDGELSVVYGESNVGKSYVVLDIGLRVSLGWSWRGLDVERGGVIYVAGEGANGIKRRVAAFRQHHGFEKTAGARFAMVPRAVNFRDKASVAGLISAVNEVAPSLGGRVRLIIVDTLSRALAGGDENSSVEMGAAVAAADRVRTETGAHVMLIHHTGKDASKGARGHSLLKGNVDTELAIERGDEDHTVIVKCDKQREMGRGGAFCLQLRQIHLGTNRRGKPITNRVVEPVEMPRPKLSEINSTCLQILNELLPEDVSEGGESVTNGVEIDVWREAVLSRLERGGVTKPNTRRVTFKRAKDELLSGGYITVSGQWVNMPW
jgi:hypothetical protein